MFFISLLCFCSLVCFVFVHEFVFANVLFINLFCCCSLVYVFVHYFVLLLCMSELLPVLLFII